MTSLNETIFYLSPLCILVVTALFVLLIDLFLPKADRKFIFGIGLAGLVLAAFASLQLWSVDPVQLFNNAIRVDRFSIFFTLIAIGITFLTFLNGYDMLQDKKIPAGELLFFFLSCCVGMSLMAWSTDLLTFFMSLEIMSLTVYILTGIQKERFIATEGAFKYFLLGAFSTGFLLYGIAFIFASVGSTQYADIANFLVTSRYTIPIIFYIGIALLLVGFAFKIALVPFHMWVPDVYEAAHPTVTGLMATGVKAAAFAAFIRLFLVTLFAIKTDWQTVITILAILTMTLGNIAALVQKNIKRMLAYSSIAHAGYILVAVCAAQSQTYYLSLSAIIFYLIGYALMTIGAFSVVAVSSSDKERNFIDDYAGFGFSHPALGVAMTIFMLSLTGIPLTAGFIGKFWIFSGALKSQLYGLTLIAMINSVIAAAYYLRVVVVFYMKEGQPAPLKISTPSAIVLGISSLGTIGLGLFPSRCLILIKQAVMGLF